MNPVFSLIDLNNACVSTTHIDYPECIKDIKSQLDSAKTELRHKEEQNIQKAFSLRIFRPWTSLL